MDSEFPVDVHSLPLIGLCGNMGAGKDTLATEICRVLPGYAIWKYASALRDAASLITGIPADKTISDSDKAADLSSRVYAPDELLSLLSATVELITGNAPEIKLVEQMITIIFPAGSREEGLRIRMTVGRFLQVLGTECFRDLVGRDVWVNALFLRWDREGRPPIVIADARFPNETAAIRQRKGVVIRVNRDSAGRADGRSSNHPSERALDGEVPDVVLDNNGSIPALGAAFAESWRAIQRQ